MWHKLIALFFFLPLSANALSVSHTNCTPSKGNSANCDIFLEGKVLAGDSLMLSSVEDMDTLYFENIKLGSTGYFAGRKFYAAYIPRVYSLDLLQGKESPKLNLKIESVFSKRAQIPISAEIKIVSANTPLRKILVRPFLLFAEFVLLFLLSIYVINGFKRGINDGWLYPRHEIRSFITSIFTYLLFHTEFFGSSVPWLLSQKLYSFAASLSAAVVVWSASRLLLCGKFVDRSCVESKLVKNIPNAYFAFSNIAFTISLLLFMSLPETTYAFALLFLLSSTSLFASLKGLEWRRIIKRSSTGSIVFHLSLMAAGFFLPLAEYLSNFNGNTSDSSKGLLVFCVLTATWRVFQFQKAKAKSAELVENIREELTNLYHGEERLQKLCETIDNEWGFSRVSLVSVQEGHGLVMASAGPEAISPHTRTVPQKLGPFLRRVCKENHMLYAPVAEELGKDLQNKGLKHSSLGIPIFQEDRVVAVLCIMAEEDARIPPYDALVIELLVKTIRLEIASAVLQSIAEERNERIIAVAKITGGLVLEHIDSWGRLRHPKELKVRTIVAAKLKDDDKILDQIMPGSIFYPMANSYKAELRELWFSLRNQFEFLSKDIRSDDFWAISPSEFKNPALRAMGHESVALLLSYLLEKHAKALSMREEFRALGLSGSKVASTYAKLNFVPLGKEDVFGMDIDSVDVGRLKKMREEAKPGQILTDLSSSQIINNGMKIRLQEISATSFSAKTKIYSILSLSIDMKELRKIEFLALERAKDKKLTA